MSNAEPKETVVHIIKDDYYGDLGFEMTLAELKTLIARIEEETPPEVVDTLKITGEADHGWEAGDTTYSVVITRMETPKEAETRVIAAECERVRQEEQSKRYREAQERAQFERLRAKFGDA